MKIFTKIISKDECSHREVFSVQLSYDERKRGRLKVNLSNKESAGIQVDRGQVLRDGTYLASEEQESDEEGAILCVKASNESVSSAYINDATLFARACYHLGNRHVPLQIGNNFLRYQADYVLDDMLKGIGILVVQEMAIFEPENGAYMKDNHTHGASKTHAHHH